MTIEDNTPPPVAATPTPTPAPMAISMPPPSLVPRVAPVERVAPRTNNQIKASALADGIAAKTKWKTLIVEAKTIWAKIPSEELATVDGNFQKLAGLVQLRQRISREDSDLQVKGFFDKHYPSIASSLRPK